MLDNKYPHNNPEFDLQRDFREAINEDPLSFEAVIIILQALIQFQPDLFYEAEMEMMYPEDGEEYIEIMDAVLDRSVRRGLLDHNEEQDVIYLPKASKRMLEQYADDMDNGILEETPYSWQELQTLQNRLNRLHGSRSKN